MDGSDRRSVDGQAWIAEIEEIYRSAPIGLCLLDTEFRFRRINERLAAINGKSAEEHLGRTVEEVLPDLAEQLLPRYRKVLDTGHAIENVEVTGILPSDPERQHTWLVSDHPIKTPNGAVSGIITVVQDVSETRRGDRELHAVRARLSEAERVAQLGCWEWDLIAGELWWSDEIYRMVGRDPRWFEPTFEEFVEHVVEEDRALVRAQLDGVYAGADSVDAEVRVANTDGTEHVMHSRARLFRKEDGEPHILFGTAQDVTEDRRKQQAFEEERRALEQRCAELERLLEERTLELDRARDRLRTRR